MRLKAVLVSCLLLAGCTVPSLPWTGPTPTSAPATTSPPMSPTAAPDATASATVVPGQATTPSPSPSGAAGSLAGRTVVIDPGHNGGSAAHPEIINKQVDAGNGVRKACNTTGTESRSGYAEHAYNFDVARRLAAELTQRGARVVLTRPDDAGVGPCITERAAVGNRERADAVVSIHADGNDAASARGFHVIVSTSMTGGPGVVRSSRTLADAVIARFGTTGMPRSTYIGGGTALSPRADIGGLNLSERPAVMVETGNMRNAADAALLADPGFRQRAARALADAVAAFLSLR